MFELKCVADDDNEIDNTKSYSSTVPVPVPLSITTSSTTTAIRTEKVLKEEEIALNEIRTGTERVSTKDVSSNLNVVTAADNVIDTAKFQRSTVGVPIITTTTTTTPIFVSNKEIVSNLNVVDADDDDIDNAKSSPECKNSIRDLDGIKDEYYQVTGKNKYDEANVGYDGVPDDSDKYGVIYDRSDDVNPPPLPLEPPAYAFNIPCIHSNIPNDGEILSLPLFSLVYRVE